VQYANATHKSISLWSYLILIMPLSFFFSVRLFLSPHRPIPQGCIELLDRSGVSIEGKEAVVIGRSNMVGIPVALLLMQRNATVTIAHSRTKDIAEAVRRADIVVAAVGRAEMVKGRYASTTMVPCLSPPSV